MVRASAYVICQDEEAHIGECLDSLRDFSDIVVVDSGSEDRTLAIVDDRIRRGYPIQLFKRTWPGYAAQKQFALEQCREDWRLNVDADERVDAELLKAISKIVHRDGPHSAYSFRRREWIIGYGPAPRLVAPDWVTRMSRRGQAVYELETLVHESIKVNGKTARIKNGWLEHLNDISIDDRITKLHNYSLLRSRYRIISGRRHGRAKILFGPLSHFFKIFLMKRYFVCGWAGFLHAAMDAQYSLNAEGLHWYHEQTKADRTGKRFTIGLPE